MVEPYRVAAADTVATSSRAPYVVVDRHYSFHCSLPALETVIGFAPCLCRPRAVPVPYLPDGLPVQENLILALPRLAQLCHGLILPALRFLRSPTLPVVTPESVRVEANEVGHRSQPGGRRAYSGSMGVGSEKPADGQGSKRGWKEAYVDRGEFWEEIREVREIRGAVAGTARGEPEDIRGTRAWELRRCERPGGQRPVGLRLR